VDCAIAVVVVVTPETVALKHAVANIEAVTSGLGRVCVLMVGGDATVAVREFRVVVVRDMHPHANVWLTDCVATQTSRREPNRYISGVPRTWRSSVPRHESLAGCQFAIRRTDNEDGTMAWNGGGCGVGGLYVYSVADGSLEELVASPEGEIIDVAVQVFAWIDLNIPYYGEAESDYPDRIQLRP
jgi:hypothetical protein